jgi:type IV secretion system protein VirB3
VANDGLTVDTLFVACTRPATLLGVPLSAVIVEIVFTLEAFIFTKNLLHLLWIFPAHGICYLICMREPRIFELIALWLQTKFLCWLGNIRFWKTSSYSPLPLQICRPKRIAKTYLP